MNTLKLQIIIKITSVGSAYYKQSFYNFECDEWSS